MKQTLIIITALMLIVGFTSGQEPIDGNTLVVKDEDGDGIYLKYAPDSDKPYSGVAVEYYDNGQKKYELTYKYGERDGKSTAWYDNGQKWTEGTYKDGKPDGLWTRWYDNGQKENEPTWKDGEVISIKCWDKDGNEIDCGY